jgi:feruloyl-CoA synthase
MSPDTRAPAYRPLPIRHYDLKVERRPDGSVVLELDAELPPTWRSIPHRLREQATRHPARTFLARRESLPGGAWGEWGRMSYGEALASTRRVAQALLDRGFGRQTPIMILSGASLEHAILAFAGMWIGAPVVAVSTGNVLLASDFGKLRHMFDTVGPTLVFVDGGAEYAPALAALPLDGVELVAVAPVPGFRGLSFTSLDAEPTAAVEAALDTVGPDTVARYIFTSGSTGPPKAVIHTHGTLCAMVACRAALLSDEARIDGADRLNWSAWSHMGSVIRLNYCIDDAGAFYIDEGKPMPGQFGETLRNLREVAPDEFMSPPIIYGQLAEALARDAALRDRFFSKVQYLAYGSASLSRDLFEAIQALAVASLGMRVPFAAKYGTSEVQVATHSVAPMEQPGEIGLPFPGVSLKLTPLGDKLEMRLKGPTVAPGYLGRPDLAASIFDEEGYYRTGDAARFLDPERPERGLMFDGRVSENFKLATGTWVSVGELRLAVVEALAPLVRDAVVVGPDRDHLGILAWPHLDEVARLTGVDDPAQALRAEPLQRFVRERLAVHNARAKGSSQKVRALAFLATPPGPNEIADKGSINQKAALAQRAPEADGLYAPQPSPDVIRIDA